MQTQQQARRLHVANVCGTSGQYGLVIDAGSSGTRLRIYCWKPVGWGTLPKISDVLERDSDGLDSTLRRRPGLSQFVHSPDQAVAQVLSLVTEARQWLPEDRCTLPSPSCVNPRGPYATAYSHLTCHEQGGLSTSVRQGHCGPAAASGASS
jgi:hypothetical protein